MKVPTEEETKEIMLGRRFRADMPERNPQQARVREAMTNSLRNQVVCVIERAIEEEDREALACITNILMDGHRAALAGLEQLNVRRKGGGA